ncbi:hypothetical protein Scep_006955 [Stephania cephalantha]|uniref:Plant heme peroxidase family profile domain-containing protein n=1 Tax=Stephania cephalantha TaxID=152367 RepID=A0AAP0K8U6_9MAGN
MALVYIFIELMAVVIVELVSVKGFRFFGAVDGLSMEYYAMRCPMAEITVRNKVNNTLDSNATLAAGLLRMHFHDCFVEINSNHDSLANGPTQSITIPKIAIITKQ